jgi:hypothetical protein
MTMGTVAHPGSSRRSSTPCSSASLARAARKPSRLGRPTPSAWRSADFPQVLRFYAQPSGDGTTSKGSAYTVHPAVN